MDKLQLQQHAEFKVNPIEVSTDIKFECFRISSDLFMGDYDDKDTSRYYFKGNSDKYIIDLQYNTADWITNKWNLQYEKMNGRKTMRENFKTELEAADFINTRLK